MKKMQGMGIGQQRFATALGLCALLMTGTAQAVALTWDTTIEADGIITAGSGTWSDGTGNWNNGTTSSGVNWNNTTPDTATFAGGDGTYAITVGSAISIGAGTDSLVLTDAGLNFANSGYTLSAASARTLTIGATTGGAFITVATGKTAIIGNNVALVKNGGASGGAIWLGGGGTLKIDAGGSFGGNAANTSASQVAGGTTLHINGGSSSWGGSLSVGRLNETGTPNHGISGHILIDSGSLTVGAGITGGTATGGNLSLARANDNNSSITINGGAVTVANNLNYGQYGNSAGVVHLNGGSLTVRRVFETTGTPTSTFNFNGGTLIAQTGATTDFMPNLDTVQVRNGGAKIDSNGQNITIAQTLLHSTIGVDAAIDGGLTKVGLGTLTLTGTNTYSGPTLVNVGTLALNNNLAIQCSALVTTGSGSVTLGSGVTTPTFGGLSGASGDLSSVIASGYASVTSLRLNPTSGTVTYGGAITDGASGMALFKTGAGTQVLAGANTYTGTTTINAGTLLVNNATGSGTGSGGVVVTNATLGGVGSISGAVTVNNGGTLAPGATAATPGTLTTSNLTFNSGSVATFDLNNATTVGAGVNDLVVINGDLLAGGTLQINVLSALTLGAPYRLFTYTGTRSGSFAVTVPNTSYVATLDTSTLGQVNVSFTFALTWKGTAALYAWDLNTSANWTNNLAMSVFMNGDAVVFDGTAQTNAANLVGTLMPQSVTVDSSDNVSLLGSGKLSGTMTLTKRGSGTLSIATANDFSGGLKIADGSVNLNNNSGAGTGTITFDTAGVNASLLGSAAITITNPIVIASGSAGTNTLGSSAGNQTVTYKGGITANTNLTISLGGTGQLRYEGIISGNGGVTTAGSGTGFLVFTEPNIYTSGFTMGGSGTIVPQGSSTGTPGSPTAGPFGTGTMILNTGKMRATTAGDVTIYNVLTLGGNLTVPTADTEKSLTFSGPATLTANRTITADVGTTVAGKALTFSGIIAESGSNRKLTKAGTGTMVLSGANTYSGGTAVNNGTLLVNNATGYGTGSGSVVVTNATLGGVGFISGAVAVYNSGTLAPGTNSVAGGVLTCAGGLTLAAGVTNAFDCTASACDKVAVTGALTIQGANTVALTFTGGTVPYRVTLFTFTSVTGGEHLDSWTVTGMPGWQRPRVRVINNTLVAEVEAGMMVSFF